MGRPKIMHRQELLDSVTGQMTLLNDATIVVVVMSSADEYVIGRHLRWHLHDAGFTTTPNLYKHWYYVHVTFTNSTNKLVVIKYRSLENEFSFSSLGCDPDQYPIWYMYNVPDDILVMTCDEFDNSTIRKKFITNYDNERNILGI